MKFIFYILGSLLSIIGLTIAIIGLAHSFNIIVFTCGLIFFFIGLYFLTYPKRRSKYLAQYHARLEETEQLCAELENTRLEDIPALDVAVNLQKSETCYFVVDVAWKEMRKTTVSRKYQGVGINIKLAKGIYYRTGNIRTVPNTNTELTLIDRGSLYFTNKRLIFAGAHGNKIIPLNKVFDLTLHSNSITIQKDTGKPASLFPTDGTPAKLMVSMISKLMQ